MSPSTRNSSTTPGCSYRVRHRALGRIRPSAEIQAIPVLATPIRTFRGDAFGTNAHRDVLIPISSLAGRLIRSMRSASDTPPPAGSAALPPCHHFVGNFFAHLSQIIRAVAINGQTKRPDPAPLRFEQRLARVLHGVLLIFGVTAVVAIVGPPVANKKQQSACSLRPVPVCAGHGESPRPCASRAPGSMRSIRRRDALDRAVRGNLSPREIPPLPVRCRKKRRAHS